MDNFVRTTTVSIVTWCLDRIGAVQLSFNLCLRFTNLIIDTILFFVSKLPWFVELCQVSVKLIELRNVVCTYESWLC
jgi:hypothetical protein